MNFIPLLKGYTKSNNRYFANTRNKEEHTRTNVRSKNVFKHAHLIHFLDVKFNPGDTCRFRNPSTIFHPIFWSGHFDSFRFCFRRLNVLNWPQPRSIRVQHRNPMHGIKWFPIHTSRIRSKLGRTVNECFSCGSLSNRCCRLLPRFFSFRLFNMKSRYTYFTISKLNQDALAYFSIVSRMEYIYIFFWKYWKNFDERVRMQGRFILVLNIFSECFLLIEKWDDFVGLFSFLK